MNPVGACPICGGTMDAETVRQTPTGVMCMECAFKQTYAQRTSPGSLYSATPKAAPQEGDSLIIGFILGFMCCPLGVPIVYLLGRGPEMKRGSVFGMAVSIVVTILWQLMMMRR